MRILYITSQNLLRLLLDNRHVNLTIYTSIPHYFTTVLMNYSSSLIEDILFQNLLDWVDGMESPAMNRTWFIRNQLDGIERSDRLQWTSGILIRRNLSKSSALSNNLWSIDCGNLDKSKSPWKLGSTLFFPITDNRVRTIESFSKSGLLHLNKETQFFWTLYRSFVFLAIFKDNLIILCNFFRNYCPLDWI